MVAIFPVFERDKKTSVRDRLHLREKPLRIERSLGPAIAPAQRRNGRLAEFRAFSSSSRTMRPMGISYQLSAVSSQLSALRGAGLQWTRCRRGAEYEEARSRGRRPERSVGAAPRSHLRTVGATDRDLPGQPFE